MQSPRAIILLGSRGRSGINIAGQLHTERRAVNAKKGDLVPQAAAAWVLIRRKPAAVRSPPLGKSGRNITAPTASHPASNSSEGRAQELSVRPAVAFKAASFSCSGSRSPALTAIMIWKAMAVRRARAAMSSHDRCC